MSLTSEEIATLTMLEEAMWIGTSRYDLAFQERHLSADFFEFGRSGNLYSRSQSLLSESAGHDFQAQLPLDGTWVMRFHQGTPYDVQAI